MIHRQGLVWMLIILATGFKDAVLAEACKKSFDLQNGTKVSYGNCSEMVTNGNVVSIAWKYESKNSILDVAFTSDLETYGGWVGWGINPNCSVMPGTSALVAYRAVNGSTILPYKLHDKLTRGDIEKRPQLACSAIDIEILSKAVDIEGLRMTMLITVRLQPNQTKVNQVWSRGLFVKDYIPSAPCIISTHNVASLDVYYGVSDIGRRRPCPIPNITLKNRHGLLNGFSWGFLYPLSIVLGYCTFCVPGFWFIHFPVQCLSFGFGIAGFHTGLLLHDRREVDPDNNKTVNYHRNLGIAILVLASIQLLSVLIRVFTRIYKGRAKSTYKYWHMAISGATGYANNILIVINIYQGIELLQPAQGWRTAWIVMSIISCFLVNGGGGD